MLSPACQEKILYAKMFLSEKEQGQLVTLL